MADLDFTDQTDFGDVERGFVGTLDDPVITAADGHVVWDCSKYVIVIDTLMSDETAAAALALYRKHRGDRPVKALLITHSHADHYGGSGGTARPDRTPATRTGLAPGTRGTDDRAAVRLARRADRRAAGG